MKVLPKSITDVSSFHFLQPTDFLIQHILYAPCITLPIRFLLVLIVSILFLTFGLIELSFVLQSFYFLGLTEFSYQFLFSSLFFSLLDRFLFLHLPLRNRVPASADLDLVLLLIFTKLSLLH